MKIGVAFSDYISTEKIKRRGRSYTKEYSIRGYLLPIILFVSVGLIFARLFFIQIIKGSSYRALSDQNRTRTAEIHAPRGIIFDRNGTPLVLNVPGFREVSDDSKNDPDKKVKLLDQDEALKFISEGKDNLEIDSLRSYTYKDAFAHVLGYTAQISKEELEQKDFQGYKAGDLVGKIGIEREYEPLLRGTNGKELIEVDSEGKTVRKLGQTDPVSGQNITLTLDAPIQNAAYEAAKDIKKGAIVVSNPKGEILALLSKPTFDPNLFTMGESYSVGGNSSYRSISDIIQDTENQPLLDRAISGVYPPGSTFKIITASAGLEEKVIDKNYTVEDTGILKLGDFSFANWYFTQYGKKEGTINVVDAIRRSNDIFFYKLADLVGVDNLSKFAEKFGLGAKTNIDLKGELSGTVPTKEWKKDVIGEDWYTGDTYHYGIGQGFLLTTPIQVNLFTQAIANNGVIYEPHLLKDDKLIRKEDKFLSSETVDLVREGMIESCSPKGVAWPLFDYKVNGKDIKVACKTGTAQHGGEEDLPHAWITLFAPAEKPEIIVTVLSESSGEGSNVAAPVAKKVLDAWFSK